MSFSGVCHCLHMGHLVVCRIGRRRGNIYSLSVDYHRGCIGCDEIELEGSNVPLVSM
jgi:hypothetical protein